jgi:hypothetical protein
LTVKGRHRNPIPKTQKQIKGVKNGNYQTVENGRGKSLKEKNEAINKKVHSETCDCEIHIHNSNDFNQTKTSQPRAGYGSCKACECLGFRQNPEDSNDYICFDCGHHYSMHS